MATKKCKETGRTCAAGLFAALEKRPSLEEKFDLLLCYVTALEDVACTLRCTLENIKWDNPENESVDQLKDNYGDLIEEIEKFWR